MHVAPALEIGAETVELIFAIAGTETERGKIDELHHDMEAQMNVLRSNKTNQPEVANAYTKVMVARARDVINLKSVDGRKPDIVRVNAALYSNSAIALRKAAVAGLGLALVPRYAVAEDLATGQLVTVLPRNRVPSRTLFAIYPSSGAAPTKVRIFVDFLAKWLLSRGMGTAP